MSPTEQTVEQPLLLIIDDDPAIRILVGEALTPHGFVVETAQSGERGLVVYEQVHPEIILLDINMPGIDGIEVCRIIRALPQGQHVPILILTGSDDTRSIEEAYQAGASDFITKPINWPVLIHHVRYMLRAAQALSNQYNDIRLQALLSSLMALKCESFDSLEEMARQTLNLIALEPLVQSFSRSCALYLMNDEGLMFIGQTDPGLTHYPERIEGLPAQSLVAGNGFTPWQALSLIEADRLLGVLLYTPTTDNGAGTRIFNSIAEKLTHLLLRIQSELEIRLTASVFANTLDGIAITDARGVLLRVNSAFEAITGFAAKDVLGKNISILKSGKQDKLFYRSLWNSLQKTGKWQGEIWNRRKNGEIYPEWLSITAIADAQGNFAQYIAVFADISNQKAQEQEIRKLAYFDDLTGLANRTLLNDRLRIALAQSERTDDSVALLFIDLDRFKNINDTLGHSVGDQLLMAVAERLKNMFREADTVARQGGDEFIVLLTNLGGDKSVAELHTARVAEQVRKVLASPIHLAQHELTVTGSIGIAFYPHDAATGNDLIKHADTAMYVAKEKGRNRFKLFHPSMAERERQRFTLETLLKKAIENGEFELHYQPQVDTHLKSVIGAECLIRWNNDQLGWVSPMDFIPLAEETGLIHDIGDWVLATACERLRHWEETQVPFKKTCRYLAVNVSPRQFVKKDFAQRLRHIILSSGLQDLSMLELELTEGCLMHHSYESIKTLAQLRNIGVRISIDDFGTGYSNLSYLRNFPLDTLKVDQSFVRDCIVDSKSQAIVKAIISMADGLGLSTIAEGVENPGQLTFLQNLGCRVFQGYLFSKPIAIDEFEAFLNESNSLLAKQGKRIKTL